MLGRLLRTPRADVEVGIAIPVGCMVPLAIVGAGVLVGTHMGASTAARSRDRPGHRRRRCRWAARAIDPGRTVALMFRGPLHNRGADGRCEECGEPFPCPTGLAIYEAVKREIEHPTPRPTEPVRPAPLTPPAARPPVHAPRWEDLDDREDRCPKCLHWWVSHGAEPDPAGCGMPTSTMDERERGEFEVCGCQQRPEPGSEWDNRLAREAERLREYDRR